MTKQVQFRRGTTAQNDAFTGADGEITVDTDTRRVRVHDGVTPGGHEFSAQTADVVDGAVTNVKLADVPEATLKGRTSAGTGAPQDLTAAQARALLNVEDGATADQTGAQIKAAYEAEADTNAFTDAEKAAVAAAAAADAVVPKTTSVNAGGLASGGGDLSADRTITVTEATEYQATAGTSGTVAITPRRMTHALKRTNSVSVWATLLPALLVVSQGGMQIIQPDSVQDRVAAIAERSAVTVWTTILPETVTVVQSGEHVFASGDVTVWATQFSGTVTVDPTGKTERPGMAHMLAAIGTNYTTDTSVAAPSAGEMHHWHVIGQSYGAGQVGTIFTTTAAHTGVALMLDAGVVPVGTPSDAFADLIATDDFECPGISAVNHMVGALEAALGSSPRMVCSAAPLGGTAYLGLGRGSGRWNESRRQMEEIRKLALASGETPVLQGLMIHQGEEDAVLANTAGAPSVTDAASIEMTVGHIMRWRQDYQELAREVYGQTREMVAVLHLTNRSYYDGALKLTPWQAACVEAARRAPHLFTVAAPTYSVEHVAWGATFEGHPTVTGYRRLGEAMGRAGLALAYGTGFQPTMPIRTWWHDASTVKVECHVPYAGGLTLDTSGDIVGTTGLTATAGFEAQDASTGTAITVSGVTVSGQTITVTLSAAPQGRTTLGYACRGPGGTPGIAGDNSDMARGLIRGSVAHTLTGSAVNSHDWLIPFTATI